MWWQKLRVVLKTVGTIKQNKCSLKKTLNHQLQKLEIVYRNVYLFFPIGFLKVVMTEIGVGNSKQN